MGTDQRGFRLARGIVERIRRAPIRHKLLLISAVYLSIIIGVLGLARLAFGFLSDVRAYVGGEGLWSKSQKDAVYSLVKYTTLQRDEDYASFVAFTAVNLGDRRARLALSQEDPDFAAAEAGFLEGRNHPDDVAGMARLFVRFGWYPKLARATDIWRQADEQFDELLAIAARIHADVGADRLDDRGRSAYLGEIDTVNARLTALEDDFSFTLGEAARQTTRWVSLALLVLTLLALTLGVLVSIGISRRIVAAIDRLGEGARRIGGGELEGRIEVTDEDELGELATAFNRMNDALAEHIAALENARAALAEMDRLKSQFFANVSHELRTPLTLILGPTTKMLESGRLPGELRRDAAVVQQNARLLLKHVNDLLDLSRLDAGRLTTAHTRLDLAALVRRVASHFEVLAADSAIRFETVAPPGLEAEVDPDQIERVLLNLLSNAFKFTPAGGTIRVSLASADERATLAVSDSGPGIPAAHRQAVFERFRQVDGDATRRHGGTGLGLAIAHELVAQHRGDIAVEESELGGTRVVVTLPLLAPPGATVRTSAEVPTATAPVAVNYLAELAPIEAPAARAAAPAKRDQPARVLVVEDNLEMRRFLAAGLAEEWIVEAAENGRAGLLAARRARPDLIVADIMMPEMSGDQMLAEVRRDPELASIPFVVLSARADDELRLRLLAEGAQDYVVKPFQLRELRTRVRNLLAAAQRSERLARSARASHQLADALGEDLVARNRELAQAIDRLTASEGHLREALDEKEVLLQEVHHRVKNNLQIVGSLIHLQEATITNPDTRRELQHCRERVRTMALLHQMLYQGTHRGRVDFGDYVRRLAAHLLRWNEADGRRIEAVIEVDSVPLEIGVAVPCGLILHELLSNALEHAFPHGGSGKVWVTGRYDAARQQLVVEVGDDGVGRAAGETLEGDGVGLALVERLVRQVGGALARGEGPGTRWRLVLTTAPGSATAARALAGEALV